MKLKMKCSANNSLYRDNGAYAHALFNGAFDCLYEIFNSLVPHKEIVFGVTPDLCGGKHWGIPGLCPDTE